jgi:hypothetical protein
VARYSRSGTFQWAATLGGAQNDGGLAIAVDSTGTDVYAVGYTNSPTSTTGGSSYLAELSGATGAVNWAKTGIGNGGQESSGSSASAVAVAGDASGCAYVVSGLASSGSNPSVTKLGPSGTQLWQDRLTSSGSGSVTVDGIAASGSNVYLSGTFAFNATFAVGSQTSTVTSRWFANGYVLWLSETNQLGWTDTFQVTTRGGAAVWTCYVGADSAGNVYATGNFLGPVNFAGSTSVKGPFVLNGGGYGDGAIYVAKLSPTGTVLWAESMATPSSNSLYADVTGIAVDGAGVYLIGDGRGTGSLSFNPAGGGALNSSTGSFFYAKLNPGGAFQWGFNSTVWARGAWSTATATST